MKTAPTAMDRITVRSRKSRAYRKGRNFILIKRANNREKRTVIGALKLWR
jgi:hypothetical protein